MSFKEEQGEEFLCDRCHWKGEDMVCHTVEPPIPIPEIIRPPECPFLFQSYWDRIPREQKDGFNADVRRRSEGYYRNK
ncbi:MAG: hypothetical protein ACOX4I_00340 [Anaerovoracaceae bacterium]|jgi:hypothetical protein